jgi:ATP-binding cassette subfamily F protein 3
VSGGKVQPFDGDLDDYRLWLTEQKKGEEKPDVESAQTVSKKDQRKLDAERRLKHKPLFDAQKKAEIAVEKYHNEQRQLELQLADPAIYEASEKEQLKKLMEQKIKIDKALEDAEAAWMEAEEMIEAVK